MYLLLTFSSSLLSSNTRSSDIKRNVMHIIQMFRAYYLSDCISDYRRPWSKRTHHVQIIPGCYSLHAWHAREGMLDFCWRSIRIWHRTIEGASCIADNCIRGIVLQSRPYRRDNIVDMNMIIQVRNFNFTAISNKCIFAWPWYVYPTWWRWFYYFIIILAFPADIGQKAGFPAHGSGQCLLLAGAYTPWRAGGTCKERDSRAWQHGRSGVYFYNFEMLRLNSTFVFVSICGNCSWKFCSIHEEVLFLNSLLFSKDLACLNRDLSKVIIIDCDPKALSLQPENAFLLKKWNGDDKDRTLVDLAAFLQSENSVKYMCDAANA